MLRPDLQLIDNASSIENVDFFASAREATATSDISHRVIVEGVGGHHGDERHQEGECEVGEMHVERLSGSIMGRRKQDRLVWLGQCEMVSARGDGEKGMANDEGFDLGPPF